jgi:hypothetical protein
MHTLQSLYMYKSDLILRNSAKGFFIRQYIYSFPLHSHPSRYQVPARANPSTFNE